jgi:LmbE family N-acetylglucosaminyl deacetylase
MATSSRPVLAPHPDDKTLGCWAMVRGTLAAKMPVEVVAATGGRHSHCAGQLSIDAFVAIREAETRSAAAFCGFPAARLPSLRFEDGRLTDYRQALQDRLSACRAEVVFEIVAPVSTTDRCRSCQGQRSMQPQQTSNRGRGLVECPKYR